MKRRWMSAALAMAVVCGVYLLTCARAQEAGRRAPSQGVGRPQAGKPASAKAAPSRPVASVPGVSLAFDGKLIAVSVRGEKQGKLLERARFVEIKGRTFLVGKEAKAIMSFPLGTDAHVAWDAVDAFYVFDSVEQYEAALRNALHAVESNLGGMLGQSVSVADLSELNCNTPFENQPKPEYSVSPSGDDSPTPAEEQVVLDPDGREHRFLKRISRGPDGREEIFYEELTDSPQLPPYGSETYVPARSPVEDDDAAPRDGRTRYVTETRPPRVSSGTRISPKPVVISNTPSRPSTYAPFEAQSNPTEASPAPALPRPVSPH